MQHAAPVRGEACAMRRISSRTPTHLRSLDATIARMRPCVGRSSASERLARLPRWVTFDRAVFSKLCLRRGGAAQSRELVMSTVFPDTATLCKSALAAAVGGEVKMKIRRYVSWAMAAAFLFSAAGG